MWSIAIVRDHLPISCSHPWDFSDSLHKIVFGVWCRFWMSCCLFPSDKVRDSHYPKTVREHFSSEYRFFCHIRWRLHILSLCRLYRPNTPAEWIGWTQPIASYESIRCHHICRVSRILEERILPQRKYSRQTDQSQVGSPSVGHWKSRKECIWSVEQTEKAIWLKSEEQTNDLH